MCKIRFALFCAAATAAAAVISHKQASWIFRKSNILLTNLDPPVFPNALVFLLHYFCGSSTVVCIVAGNSNTKNWSYTTPWRHTKHNLEIIAYPFHYPVVKLTCHTRTTYTSPQHWVLLHKVCTPPHARCIMWVPYPICNPRCHI